MQSAGGYDCFLFSGYNYGILWKRGERMFGILQKLLADRTDGVPFRCFDFSHICFIVFFVAAGVLLCLHLRNKSVRLRKKVTNTVISIAFGLYVAELFLMPFAYGVINIDKLPFHVCTAMCVMCFWSRHNVHLRKFRLQFAMLGFLSNLTYLVYPAGMMWLNIHPMSYRVVQTLIFHGVMMVYGLLVLVYESKEFAWKRIYKDLIVVVSMTAWARLGNALYNSGEKLYNWFFVVQDPFGLFPENIAPYIMPFLNILLFFGVELAVYGIISKALQRRSQPATV